VCVISGKHENRKSCTKPDKNKYSPGNTSVKKENHQERYNQWAYIAQQMFPAPMDEMTGEHAMPVGNIPWINTPKILIGGNQVKIKVDQEKKEAKRQRNDERRNKPIPVSHRIRLEMPPLHQLQERLNEP